MRDLEAQSQTVTFSGEAGESVMVYVYRRSGVSGEPPTRTNEIADTDVCPKAYSLQGSKLMPPTLLLLTVTFLAAPSLTQPDTDVTLQKDGADVEDKDDDSDPSSAIGAFTVNPDTTEIGDGTSDNVMQHLWAQIQTAATTTKTIPKIPSGTQAVKFSWLPKSGTAKAISLGAVTM